VILLLNNRSVRKSRANVFLSILLLALCFSIAHILFAGLVINHLDAAAKVYSLGDPTFFLIAPLLWFYTQELTGHTVRLSWALIIHFLPFMMIVTLSLTLRSVDPGNAFIQFLEHHHRLINVVFWLGVVVQFSSYQLMIRKRWVAYRVMIQQEMSNTENVDFTWVRFFMFVYLLINLFFFFSLFAAIHLEDGAWLPRTTALIFSLSVFALGYKGILQRDFFKQREKIEEDPAPMMQDIPKVINKPDEQLIKRILVHMDEKKPYLDPELTLSQLAKDLNIGRSQLSQLINDNIGDNFYDFINKYRTEEVKRLMNDPKVKNFSLLGLALEAGFKSKSTFNLIFKRFTGLTPTAYKKNKGEL